MNLVMIFIICTLFFFIFATTIYGCKKRNIQEGFFKKIRRSLKRAFKKKRPKHVTKSEHRSFKKQTNKLSNILDDIIEETKRDNELRGDLLKVKTQSNKFIKAISDEGGNELLEKTKKI